MREDATQDRKLIAKPIGETPVLKGQDLANLVNSLAKKDNDISKQRRSSALSLLHKVSK
ncbi:hypothetical protein bcgnr5372_26260 [Bacillus luti]|nr:hypothetical protein [Bacillus cereus]HDR8329417.1 hypothetical protein [Bacillus cereus]HDR8335979.1 hypothetical protein [Bacillus cereus]